MWFGEGGNKVQRGKAEVRQRMLNVKHKTGEKQEDHRAAS